MRIDPDRPWSGPSLRERALRASKFAPGEFVIFSIENKKKAGALAPAFQVQIPNEITPYLSGP